MSDLISVIVPVYNTGIYLERCVESIVAQDYSPLEIILVDDGSKDKETIELCDKLAALYENVQAYHKPNGGSASARNYGIKIANGKYIGFVDSDDVIEPYMYSTLYYDLTTSNAQVATIGIATEENGKLVDRVAPVPTGVYDYTTLMHHFMLGSFHSACTNLYDRDLFQGVEFPEGEVNEDYMFNYWVFRKVSKVAVNDNTLYHYIRREGSNTGSPASLRFLDWLKHTNLVYEEMKHDTKLVAEAEYQNIFPNVILANKSLLTLGRMKSEEATKLYKLSIENLKANKSMVLSNKYLTGRYRKMAVWMIRFPWIYKWSIITALKIKHAIK